MKPTINFLVDHIGASHMAFYMIEQAHKLSEQGKANVSIFYDQLHRPCRRVMLPTMLMVEAWAQPGVSIATSMSTAARLLSFPGPQHKLFYVWDMSWMNNPKPYGPATQLFRNPKLSIIARCQAHAMVLENNFNIDVEHVFDNFDHTKLLEAISHEQNRKTEEQAVA